MALDRTRFVASFLADAHEHLSAMDRCLLEWEQGSAAGSLTGGSMDGVFRAAHTLKGAARMMRFPAIAVTAHKMEDLFGALRDQRVVWSSRVADLLFAGLDAIRGLLEQVANGAGALEENEALCLALEQMARGEGAAQPSPVAREDDSPVPTVVPSAAALVAASPGSEGGGEVRGATGAPPVGQADRPDASTQPPALGEPPGAASDSAHPREMKRAPFVPGTVAIRPIGRGSDATIRMEASQIDRLLQTVGESLSFRKRIRQRLHDVKRAHALCETVADNRSGAAAGRLASLQAHLHQTMIQMREDVTLLDLVFDALHVHTLEMRLLPLSTLFDMLPRLARDLAKASGKQIELVVRGGETRLDRVIIEKLGDVFLHLLRNAVDHGIEPPERRQRLGKSPQGSIQVVAGTQGGDVTIELRDDGGGIDLARLQTVAVQKGLFTEEGVTQLSRAELIELIFHPGLSTHSIVTDLSGRGVGMDVVKKNIVESLRGSIRVDSDPGQGTRFLIRLPLTLATVRVVLFRVAGLLFAMPGSAIGEVLQVADSALIPVVGGRAVRLREQVVPVLALQSLLGITPSVLSPVASGRHTLLVLNNRQECRGLLCDGLVDEDVVVLKPLPYFMRRHPFASGMMITAQNEIVLVLDGGLLWKQMQQGGGGRASASEPVDWQGAALRKHLLVVDDSRNTREIEQAILQAAGYQVSVAENGAEGYEKAAQQTYDLVVTDVEMPVLDGFSLTRKLRLHDQYRHTPIILVTSRDKEEDKRRGIEAGASAYIVKGAFDQSNLLDTVRTLLGE
ncbi:MAG: hybrid sensor histidine kinase/response regulator [Magnetococcus sp. MYC-9]